MAVRRMKAVSPPSPYQGTEVNIYSQPNHYPKGGGDFSHTLVSPSRGKGTFAHAVSVLGIPGYALHLRLDQPEVLLGQEMQAVEECERPVLGRPTLQVFQPRRDQHGIYVVRLIEHYVRARALPGD